MKNNRVLTIDQCKELLSLGLKMANASALWTAIVDEEYNPTYWLPVFRNDDTPIEVLKLKYPLTYKDGNIYYTYTLEDMLDILPLYDLSKIYGTNEYSLSIFDKEGNKIKQFIGENPMDVAFKMVKYCTERGI